jgi:ATP phosphoribosyltransferase regulatory subunit HisZ
MDQALWANASASREQLEELRSRLDHKQLHDMNTAPTINPEAAEQNSAQKQFVQTLGRIEPEGADSQSSSLLPSSQLN